MPPPIVPKSHILHSLQPHPSVTTLQITISHSTHVASVMPLLLPPKEIQQQKETQHRGASEAEGATEVE